MWWNVEDYIARKYKGTEHIEDSKQYREKSREVIKYYMKYNTAFNSNIVINSYMGNIAIADPANKCVLRPLQEEELDKLLEKYKEIDSLVGKISQEINISF